VRHFVFTLRKFQKWFKGNTASSLAALISCSYWCSFFFISACGIYSEFETGDFWKRRNLLTLAIKGRRKNSKTTLASFTGVRQEGIVLTVGPRAYTGRYWKVWMCCGNHCIPIILVWLTVTRLLTVKTLVHCRIMEKLFTSHVSHTSPRFCYRNKNKIGIVFRQHGLISK
jgi:hypothetical protein